jgi:hypothetical protein
VNDDIGGKRLFLLGTQPIDERFTPLLHRRVVANQEAQEDV